MYCAVSCKQTCVYKITAQKMHNIKSEIFYFEDNGLFWVQWFLLQAVFLLFGLKCNIVYIQQEREAIIRHMYTVFPALLRH
jgi:hypothetical protein